MFPLKKKDPVKFMFAAVAANNGVTYVSSAMKNYPP